MRGAGVPRRRDLRRQAPALQIPCSLAYTHVFALVLRYRVIASLQQAVRHRLRVTAVYEEAPGVVSILVTGEHLHELAAEPGQFFRRRFRTPDHWATARPFSLSAAPTDTALRLTVKALGDGSCSLQTLPVGTWVIAEGPYGAITSARRTRRDVLLVAGGVGITPMRALFESLPVAPGGDVLLVYRARSEEELVFRLRRACHVVMQAHGALSGSPRSWHSGVQVITPYNIPAEALSEP